jgi:polysaccharide pyruvyl transferase WcaK-like protein
MNKLNILLLGASLESDNKGVNALGVGAITLLNKNFKNATINLLCVGNPEVKEKLINGADSSIKVMVYYISKFDILRSIKEAYIYRIFGVKPKVEVSQLILSSDIAFDINEGDSFSDIYGSKRIIRHFTDSKLILSWKKPLVFLPQTIGPFGTIFGKFLGKHILKRLKKLYVRDEKAFPFLNKMDIQKDLTIDMAVYMAPQKPDIEIQPNTVGINVSGLMYLKGYKTLEGKYENYPVFLKKLVNNILQEGYEVLLVPHTYNKKTPNFEDDLKGIKNFLKDNPELSKRVLFIDEEYSAQELKYIISKTIFFMGSRMHSCIAGLSTSVPTIGLSYSYKFEGTFKMFKQQGLVFDINYLEEKSIENLIKSISAKIVNRSEIKSVLLKENKREELILKI